MPSQLPKPDELDSPWKEALEHFLESFLAFCFPNVHSGIDWSRGYQSLDKELHQIVREARVKKRLADKLFKVWRSDGEEAWVLVHVEVQGQREETFPERMYVYNYRIFDRHRRHVVSLAVLCDDQAAWRPDYFGYNVLGCEVGIRFPMVKLIDYRRDEAPLERSVNPFAAVILAHLKVLDTRRAPATRWQSKLRLVKGLYGRGLKREQIRQLMRIIDWMLALPPEMEQSFRAEVHRFEEARQMPYVTSFERLAREEGRQEGRQEGHQEGRREGRREGREEGVAEGFQAAVLEFLELKFKKVGAKQSRKVRSVRDVQRLQAILRAAKDAETLDEALAVIRDD
jgi:hypothetical protein